MTFYEGDVMDEAALKAMFEKENVDAVIHCAALKSVGESVQKPLEYYRNNITGTLTLMDVMKQTSVKNIDKLKVLIMYEVIRFMNYLFFYSNLIYLWKVKYHYFMHISKHSVSYGILPICYKLEAY
nr:GDP-mannose 4,6-dehydratase [Dorea longicatena]